LRYLFLYFFFGCSISRVGELSKGEFSAGVGRISGETPAPAYDIRRIYVNHFSILRGICCNRAFNIFFYL
jgi:hypothetical protein